MISITAVPAEIPASVGASAHKKGFLKGAFANAALGAFIMGTARLGFTAAVQAAGWYSAGTAAVISGVVSTGYQLAKDTRAARASATPGSTIPVSAWTILKDNRKKYATRFLTSTAMALVGAGIVHSIMENFETVKDFAAGLAGGTVLPTPPPSPAVAFHDVASPVLPPVLPVVEMITPDAKLAELSVSGKLGERAQSTIAFALKGKSWAMNETIDGLFNGRYGFTQNRELAAELTKELAAKGDEGGLLKLAFMQNNRVFESLGVDYSPKAAVETIKNVGKGWYGSSTLVQNLDVTTCTATQNPAGAFETPCTPLLSALKPGKNIGLNVIFNDGQTMTTKISVGESANEMPAVYYLQNALSSTLDQISKMKYGSQTAPALLASAF